MDPKPRPNHGLYLQILRRMTPQQRLDKAFELTALARELFLHGLRRRYPNLSDEQFHQVALEHLRRCHNRNY